MPELDALTQASVALLEQLIGTPSISREENGTADLLLNFLAAHGASPQRCDNNVWTVAPGYAPDRPTVLLNSHHDTVKPGAAWTYPPFAATWEGDKLIGLGSNDAGASVVSLLATFLYLKDRPRAYNLICAITAEEEISGANGIVKLLPELGPIALGIVGEPTQMQLAIAEKGLLVLDCLARGKTGHAARDEGENALYRALNDINWLINNQLPRVSPLLGPVKTTATQISAGQQHNVVPDECRFVVDVRTNELYSNAEVVEILQQNLQSEITPRSLRLNSSHIAANHPIVQRGRALGKDIYGSPTLSDQALMPFATVKIGPGDSARSHTPNEFILRSEIISGVRDYVTLLTDLVI